MVGVRSRILFLLAMPVMSAADLPRYASLDGHRIAYVERGSGGSALVLIHGWTCDHTFWRDTIPELSKSRRVIAVDLPGHGSSDKPEIVYSMELFARAVNAVLEQARVEKAVLAGHSMGTAVALTVHRLSPEKVAALVIVDGFIPMKRAQPEGREVFLTPFRTDYEATINRMINSMFVDGTPADARDYIRARMTGTPAHVGRSAMEEITKIDPAALQPIGLPALAVMARRPQRDEAYEKFLRSFLPQLTYESWPDAGHFLMMEQPERFNAALARFLASHGL
jgi:pimeloyl-ACP methyl ester carboxylesterase